MVLFKTSVIIELIKMTIFKILGPEIGTEFYSKFLKNL